jgi:hypothetical protein
MPADPILQELNRRAVTQRGVAATPVIEHLDVLEEIGLDLGPRRVGGAVPPFVLQAVEEALGRRDVPAVALATHRRRHPVFHELVAHGQAGVLTALVAVEDDALVGPAPEPRHRQRVRHDVSRNPGLDLPAHHFAVEQVQHDGQVQPAFARLDVGDVTRPHAVGRHRHRMPGVRRGLVAPLVASADAVFTHQVLHPSKVDPVAPSLQLPVHSSRAMGSLDLRADALDQRQRLRIRQPRAIRLSTAAPGPVAADAHGQHLTHVGQRVVAALRVDLGVLHSASFAKYAVAFFCFDVHLQPRVLRSQPGQLHLHGRHGLGAGPDELAGFCRLHPVAQRLLNQPQLSGRHNNAYRLGVLDCRLLELGRAFLLRDLLHVSSFRSQC